MQNPIYMVFGHKYVLAVCEHIHPTMIKIHPIFESPLNIKKTFGQDTGVTPLLFTRSAMGFLMTTESQDHGLTSHPKDGAF